MSNSPLVKHTKLSPNRSSPRNKPITKITIHHMAGNMTIESCGNLFASPTRQGSSNYGIGTDGRVGMYVEEKNRAWTSSSPPNDNQAVTIEVANCETGGEWKVSDKAFSALIDLCVDICSRNDIKELVYTGKPDGSLTHHRMFEPTTTCPGAYLLKRFPEICKLVNARLKKGDDTEVVGTMKVSGGDKSESEIPSILKDGSNFTKLRDMVNEINRRLDLNIQIEYNDKTKVTTFKKG